MTVNGYLCNILYGTYVDGCSCTVYYTDSPTEANIYSVDIYGVEDPYPSEQEDQGGWAGSNYYENEYGYDSYDDGGWAGSNYYDDTEGENG